MTSSLILLGALLAVGSGTSYSALDSLRKRLARDLSPLAILLGIAVAQIPVHAGVLLVSGWPRVDVAAFAGLVVAAGAVAIAANVLLVRAFARAPLSLVVPLLSFTPAFTLLTGWIFLGQQPGVLGLLGVGLVVAGALLLEVDPAQLRGDPLRTLRSPGSGLALAVAALFSLGNAIDRRTVLHASEPLYALSLTAFIALVVGALPGPRRELLRARGLRPWVAAGGAVMAAALLLQLLAFRFLPIASVDAIKRATANVASALLGHAFFAEQAALRRGLAGLVMSLGVALLLLG